MFGLSKFGERLRIVLEQKDIQGKELAKILNVEPPTVSNWLNGNRFPKDDMLIQIADYFNVSVDYLLGRTDQPHGFFQEADIDGHHYEFELDKNIFPNGITREQMINYIKELEERNKELEKEAELSRKLRTLLSDSKEN
ncbi:helix-turn-helix domain-containing protein [Clostridium tepidum]|uniref:helix-turn-helix domain-containing protein n=1 Tax=Clostridium tepidum TaxID=1962263 RepID=UPI001F294891|nr:helix-turn-helix transcriptional regulator [Clostridium tepidum]